MVSNPRGPSGTPFPSAASPGATKTRDRWAEEGVELSTFPASQWREPPRLTGPLPPLLYTLFLGVSWSVHRGSDSTFTLVTPPWPCPAQSSLDSMLSIHRSQGHLTFNMRKTEANTLPSSPTSSPSTPEPTGVFISGPTKTNSCGLIQGSPAPR